MKEITAHRGDGLNDAIAILAYGAPGPGGAHRRYLMDLPGACGVEPVVIRFQEGDPAEGVNGYSNEALIAIVVDRLEGFQAGPFPCPENKIALEHLRSAMDWLHARTAGRVDRGVEGHHAP